MANTVYLTSGVTAKGVQSAISALKSGDTLILPKNKIFSFTESLKVDVSNRSVTIDLNGATLKQAGDITVLSVLGGHADGASAVLGKNAGGSVTVKYNGASAVSVGDHVKLYSDDALPNDQGATTRLGQALKVTAVNGNTLTLGGDLHYAELYKTNVRASAYEGGTAVVRNGTVLGDQSHPSWTKALVEVRSTVDTQLEHMSVKNGNSMGFNFVDSVNGRLVQSSAINLTDNTAKGHYGYGVHSASSVNTTVDGFYAEKVRHATDDNAIGLTRTHADPSKYGADYGMNVSNVIAKNTTAYAFSWHSEGRFNSVKDSLVFDSYGVLGARGLNNEFSNVSGAGNGRGIVFFEYGDGDARGITVNGVNLKENSGYAYYNQNSPWGNTISNSVFEILSNKVTISPNDPSTTIKGVTLKIGAFATNETIAGTAAGDQLLGGKGIDRIDGKAGNDFIWGGSGADILTGGGGIDRFAYHAASEAGDVIKDFKGGPSGDVIDVSVMSHSLNWDSLAGHARFVQSGANSLFQVDTDGGGNSYVTLATLEGVAASSLTASNISDSIFVTNNGSKYTGGVVAKPGAPAALPSAFADLGHMARQLGSSAADTLLGTAKADLLIGGAGRDWLNGMASDDMLAGGGGADILMGGSGKDTASYADASSGVTVSLKVPATNTGDAAGDSFSQIENLMGSAYADRLTGNSSVNVIFGLEGNDVLYGLGGADTLNGGDGNDRLEGGTHNDILIGGAGADILIGGSGYDKLTGGSGADTFVLTGISDIVDTITDFQHGVDKIGLTTAFGIGSIGDLIFVSNAKPAAVRADPTLLYNENSGTLWWDADGTGWRAPVKIMVLDNAPDLTLSDIILF
ncbi:calcium-binding protein [Sphingobium sp. CECT 9361]|uniref:calcium-binding protein n=1 Tax=Sphingobium sp. CECT 9361 TaxID=2845384 RepID=UPI001E44AA23|nr:calcium-binding protein [Sphingobium sp. CECT 9361]CAH0356480.1 hypothetical protein SPH9361_04122 [Sphingobium sp. CECT 9361]